MLLETKLNCYILPVFSCQFIKLKFYLRLQLLKRRMAACLADPLLLVPFLQRVRTARKVYPDICRVIPCEYPDKLYLSRN